jgi:hypothetical protein
MGSFTLSQLLQSLRQMSHFSASRGGKTIRQNNFTIEFLKNWATGSKCLLIIRVHYTAARTLTISNDGISNFLAVA